MKKTKSIPLPILDPPDAYDSGKIYSVDNSTKIIEKIP